MSDKPTKDGFQMPAVSGEEALQRFRDRHGLTPPPSELDHMPRLVRLAVLVGVAGGLAVLVLGGLLLAAR